MSFDILSVFLKGDEDEDINIKSGKKKITTVGLAKDAVLRRFQNELIKLPDISQNDIIIYSRDLERIEDFEEGNMKMYAYCYPLARMYNFDYNNMKENYESVKEKGLSMFKEFKKDDDNSTKLITIMEFLADIYIYCYKIIATRDKNKMTRIVEDDTDPNSLDYYNNM